MKIFEEFKYIKGYFLYDYSRNIGGRLEKVSINSKHFYWKQCKSKK